MKSDKPLRLRFLCFSLKQVRGRSGPSALLCRQRPWFRCCIQTVSQLTVGPVSSYFNPSLSLRALTDKKYACRRQRFWLLSAASEVTIYFDTKQDREIALQEMRDAAAIGGTWTGSPCGEFENQSLQVQISTAEPATTTHGVYEILLYLQSSTTG